MKKLILIIAVITFCGVQMTSFATQTTLINGQKIAEESSSKMVHAKKKHLKHKKHKKHVKRKKTEAKSAK